MAHPGSAPGTVTLTIDGKEVTVPAGTTIFDAARMNGVHIPVLCHQQNETPVGVCRMCVVDVNQRTYAAACIRTADPGMVVRTHSQPVREARKTLLEMLIADHPTPCVRQQRTADCELEKLAHEYGVSHSRYPVREVRSEEHTSELQSHSDLVCRLLLEKKKQHAY